MRAQQACQMLAHVGIIVCQQNETALRFRNRPLIRRQGIIDDRILNFAGQPAERLFDKRLCPKARRGLSAHAANLLLREVACSSEYTHPERRTLPVLTLDSDASPVQP